MRSTEGTDILFDSVVHAAYGRIRERFSQWAIDDSYRSYVVPIATDPDIGFAIFYTPPAFRPRLLVVGQNPSNFAGQNRSLLAHPNAEMLAGRAPTESSYDAHDHLFGIALRSNFQRYPDIYINSVGMNVWYFQCISNATAAPKPLREFCEATTRDVVAAMQPQHVLCIGRAAFTAMVGKGMRVEGARKAETTVKDSSRFWYVPHLTGSWSRSDAEFDLPIVIEAMLQT